MTKRLDAGRDYVRGCETRRPRSVWPAMRARGRRFRLAAATHTPGWPPPPPPRTSAAPKPPAAVPDSHRTPHLLRLGIHSPRLFGHPLTPLLPPILFLRLFLGFTHSCSSSIDCFRPLGSSIHDVFIHPVDIIIVRLHLF